MNLRRLFRWPRANVAGGGGISFIPDYAGAPRITASTIKTDPIQALNYTPVARAISSIAVDLARCGLVIQERDGCGWTNEEMPGDLSFVLNDEPNEFQTATDFLGWIVNQCLLYGNSFALISRRGAEVEQLIPLRSHEMQLLVDSEGRWFYNSSEWGRLPPEDVLHMRAPQYKRVGWGDSPTALAAESIALGILMDQGAVDAWRTPGLAKVKIETEEAVGADKVRAIQESFTSVHASREGVLKPIVVQNGSSVDNIGSNLSEMEWSVGRREIIADIARAFGIPPFVLFTETTASWSEEESRMYADGLGQWAFRLATEMSNKLLDDADTRIRFDTSRLLRGGFSETMSAYQIAIQSSIMTPNEVRLELGLGTEEGLDEFFAGPNMMTGDGDPDEAEETEEAEDTEAETPSEGFDDAAY